MQIFNNPSIPHRSVHSFWGVEWRLVLRHAYIENFQEASFKKDWGFIQCIFTLAWYTVFLMGLEWCSFTSFNVSFTFLSKKKKCIFYFSMPCFIHFSCRLAGHVRNLQGSFVFCLAFWLGSEWQRKLISRARGNSGFSFIMLWVLVLFFFLYFLYIYIYIYIYI